MKRFIRNAVAFAIGAALGSCTVLAHATMAKQFQLQNKGGGQMVITDEPCVVNGETVEELNRAFAFIPSGESIEGCWGLTSEEVVTIVWFLPDGRRVKVDYPTSAWVRVKLTRSE